MSKKTVLKRIALTAVSALAAGTLTVIAVPGASAADNVNAGTTQTAALTEGTLNIATLASTSGTATVMSAVSSNVPVALASVGLINVSDTAAGLYAGTTQTAVLLNTGTIVVYTEAETANEGQLITVENGTIAQIYGSDVTTAVNGSRTAAAGFGIGGGNDYIAVAITPNSGATSMTIKAFSKTSASSAAAHVVSSSQGDLIGQIFVTIASSSTAGALSTATSGAYWGASASLSSLTADATGYSGSTDYGRNLYLDVRVRDVYGTAITSTGLLQAVVTGGARVNVDPSGNTDTGSGSSDYYSGAAPDSEEILISNPTGNPIAGTVTISWNGTVIATRSYGFSGKVAKITLSSPVIGKTGGSANIVTYKTEDAAGNSVYVDLSGTDNTTTPPSGFAEDVAVTSGSATAVTVNNRDFSINTSTGVVTTGRIAFTCSSTAGAGKIGITYTNTDGSIVKSNVLDVKCAGDAVKYQASYDKAVYAPGEIATLTLTFLDSKGNRANDITDVDSDGAAGEITVSTSGMAQTVSGPSDSGASGADIDQGTLTFKYAVGTTEGTYTNVINVPDVNEAATAANISGTSAVSASFTVKAAPTGAVTNAEVLAAIVKLIASINKQIRALQKQLRR